MTWFKVDDGFAFHPKAIAAGNAALGLWVRSGSWSSQQLTDGFIPDRMVRQIGTKGQAQNLLSAGLWVEGDGGLRFHQWAGRQPTRTEVEEKRARDAERLARWREEQRRKEERP